LQLQGFCHRPDICAGHRCIVGRASGSKPINGRLRVRLPADLTLAADETTGFRLRRLAVDARIEELLLDGHKVSDVSVRGLGLLVAVNRLACARGAIAVVVDPSPVLARFITSLGLTERLLLVSPDAAPPEETERSPLHGSPLRSVPALH
jgi:anti-anti-sigma regulatory factor